MGAAGCFPYTDGVSSLRYGNGEDKYLRDDPMSCIRGDGDQRNESIAIILFLWASCDMPLSLMKARRGNELTWTAAAFKVKKASVVVRLKKELVTDILAHTERCLHGKIGA